MDTQFEAVRATLSMYFDGLYHSDTELLRRVFHPAALYLSASEVPHRVLTMDEYFPVVAARPAPASRGEARVDEIVSIEFAGARSAFARVHCAIGERYFTDLLTLVRDEHGWRIISKVFHFETRP